MNRKDAEKMADDIFDMIDRNHPRGLIKSELVDLLAKFEPGVIETDPFPPKPDADDWIPIKDLVEEARKALRRPPGGYYYISTTGTSPKIYGGTAGGDLCGND